MNPAMKTKSSIPTETLYNVAEKRLYSLPIGRGFNGGHGVSFYLGKRDANGEPVWMLPQQAPVAAPAAPAKVK